MENFIKLLQKNFNGVTINEKMWEKDLPDGSGVVIVEKVENSFNIKTTNSKKNTVIEQRGIIGVMCIVARHLNVDVTNISYKL